MFRPPPPEAFTLPKQAHYAQGRRGPGTDRPEVGVRGRRGGQAFGEPGRSVEGGAPAPVACGVGRQRESLDEPLQQARRPGRRPSRCSHVSDIRRGTRSAAPSSRRTPRSPRSPACTATVGRVGVWCSAGGQLPSPMLSWRFWHVNGRAAGVVRDPSWGFRIPEVSRRGSSHGPPARP